MDVREKLVELFYDNNVRCDQKIEGLADDVMDIIDNGVTVQECGHWKIIMDDYDCEMMRCSVCGSEFYDGDNDTVDCLHNYCPHCGAKMMPQPPKAEMIYCKDCEHLMFSDCYGECAKGNKGIVQPNGTCEHARRKPPKGE